MWMSVEAQENGQTDSMDRECSAVNGEMAWYGRGSEENWWWSPKLLGAVTVLRWYQYPPRFVSGLF